MARTKARGPLLAAALDYAEQGFLVFPCSPEKAPLTHNGFQDASGDAAQIEQWWARSPEPLVGLCIPEGTIVVDIDPRNGGDETIKALRREHGRGAFPATRTASTGGGGIHRWYAVDPELRLRGKLGVGVDVKRAGKGYVIAPPSASVLGPYAWRSEQDSAEAPEWMVELLRRPDAADRANEDRTPPEIFPFMDGTAYGEKALALELEAMADAQPGERNDALNRAAYSLAQLVAGGELKEDAVRDRLAHAAEEMGLEPGEIELTIGSGMDAGFAEPRSAPELEDRAERAAQPSTRSVLDQLEDGDEDAEAHFWLDWSGEPAEDEYIVAPVIPRNAYVLVYGATEAAKSMVFNWFGAEASRRGFTCSVYSLENPPNVDRQRLQRLDPDGENFRLSNQLVNLADPRQAIAMMERERGRDIVVLDTYSHAFAQRYDSGDGNAKAIEFARVVRWLMRKTGATFVVIDHTGFDRIDEPRDASAKRQQVDVAIGMERTRPWERGRPAFFRMTNFKSARFANPFTIDGKILGNVGEPLSIVWERGEALEWGEPE